MNTWRDFMWIYWIKVSHISFMLNENNSHKSCWELVVVSCAAFLSSAFQVNTTKTGISFMVEEAGQKTLSTQGWKLIKHFQNVTVCICSEQ